ncbi:conserved hypothetical protein [Pediculus humanus corporis]|uniref:Late endosomal/lysosomal adaptor and MAPK and MTOR activator 4 n=1 Tax=Pediculus humanus subsp. corporis TaxID=121224 RepID=E0VI46_PEDHC|nr:uncharacterized protein Phum_PHUM220830 [Pediculus humanus corporis]EEB13052.1 conserved hypothetical protein [Pediculus humanus corporis]
MNPSKIQDQLGYLVLHESGATISSSGDLENDEKTAEIIYNLISVADKLDVVAFPSGGFNKISICFKDFCYVVCMSNKKIHIVKRKFPTGQSSPNTPAEPNLIDLQPSTSTSDNP